MDTDSDSHAPEEHGANERSPPVAMPQQPNSEPTQAERDAKQERDIQELRRRDKILFRVALFGAFIAFVSAVVSTLQWQVMREQLSDSRKAAAESEKITARTVAASEKQASASVVLAETNKVMSKAALLNAQNSERIATANEQGTANAGRATQLSQEIARSKNGGYLP